MSSPKLIVCAFALALLATGCNRSNDAVVEAKAEMDAAKADGKGAPPPCQIKSSTNLPQQESLLGTWDWGWGEVDPGQETIYQNSITLHADNSVSEPGGQTGKWERTGNVVSITWGNGTIDTVTVSEDGTKLNGQSHTGTPVRARKR